MDELDCDGKLMKSPMNGRQAERDIVQFVPLRKFQSYGQGSDGSPSTSDDFHDE